MLTLHHPQARGRIHAEPLTADGDFSICPHPYFAALAKDVGPPRTLGSRPQDRALVRQGLFPGRLRSAADFPVLFHLVMMFAQGLQEFIGRAEFGDVFRQEERRQPFLPELVATLYFTFCLRGGGIAQGDIVKAEGRGQLGV